MCLQLPWLWLLSRLSVFTLQLEEQLLSKLDKYLTNVFTTLIATTLVGSIVATLSVYTMNGGATIVKT